MTKDPQKRVTFGFLFKKKKRKRAKLVPVYVGHFQHARQKFYCKTVKY